MKGKRGTKQQSKIYAGPNAKRVMLYIITKPATFGRKGL